MKGRYLDFLFGTSVRQVEKYVESWRLPTFVGLILWEFDRPNDNLKLLVKLFNQRNISVTLVFNTSYQYYSKELEALDCNILYFNFFLWRTYNEIVLKNQAPVADDWNATAENFLFLTGKPNKPNRIRLLYKFAQKELLTHCTWSLYVHSGNSDKSHEWVKELDNIEYKDFLKKYLRNPDNANVEIQHNDIHYGGIPYDVNLFKNTKFRVISETSMYNPYPFLTEKTWITILNRQPFVIAGDVGSNNVLSKLGFKTFEHYVPLPSYDNIDDVEERLNLIVEHTKFWVSGDISIEKVKEDVDYNYNKFISLALDSKKKFEESLKNIGINSSINEVIETADDIC